MALFDKLMPDYESDKRCLINIKDEDHLNKYINENFRGFYYIYNNETKKTKPYWFSGFTKVNYRVLGDYEEGDSDQIARDKEQIVDCYNFREAPLTILPPAIFFSRHPDLSETGLFLFSRYKIYVYDECNNDDDEPRSKRRKVGGKKSRGRGSKKSRGRGSKKSRRSK